MILAVRSFCLPFLASLRIYYINTTKIVKGFRKLFFESVNCLWKGGFREGEGCSMEMRERCLSLYKREY